MLTSGQEAQMRDQFAQYIDRDGLVQPMAYPPNFNASGNGLLYTAEMYIILARTHVLNAHDLKKFESIIMSCEVERGLLKRSPTHGDQEGPDDYIGVTAASYILNRTSDNMSGMWRNDIAQRILEYGERVKVEYPPCLSFNYVYNNVKPGTSKHPDGRTNWSALFARMPQVVAHLKLAAKQQPSTIEMFVWQQSVMGCHDKPKNDQTARILSWLMVMTGHGQNDTCDRTTAEWYRRLKSQFPGGMRQVVAEYFQNPDHPLAKHWVDDDPNV